MSRIAPRLPVELLEKVGANNRQVALVHRGRAAHGVREGKREGQEREGEMALSVHGESSVVS